MGSPLARIFLIDVDQFDSVSCGLLRGLREFVKLSLIIEFSGRNMKREEMGESGVGHVRFGDTLALGFVTSSPGTDYRCRAQGPAVDHHCCRFSGSSDGGVHRLRIQLIEVHDADPMLINRKTAQDLRPKPEEYGACNGLRMEGVAESFLPKGIAHSYFMP